MSYSEDEFEDEDLLNDNFLDEENENEDDDEDNSPEGFDYRDDE